jgi:hypothetical protein
MAVVAEAAVAVAVAVEVLDLKTTETLDHALTRIL